MIVLAADHGGYELAQHIKKKYAVSDVGAQILDDLDDFPPFVDNAIAEIKKTKDAVGIIICGSGIGVSIAANRHKGIRAALCHSVEYARAAREHNDANVLCLGGRFLKPKEAEKIIDTFLHTEFIGGKYKKRMDMIDGKF